MSSVKTYTVTIFGQSFNLVSDEAGSSVEEVAAQVDCLMKQISNESGVSDCKKVAILAAVKLLCQVQELRRSNDQLHNEHHRLIQLCDDVL